MSQNWNHVWITGASSGIGHLLALTLAKRGIKVSVSARRAEALNELANANENIHAYPLDVTDDEAAQAIAAQIEQDHGPLDLVVLNAGQWAEIRAHDYSAERARKMMDVNYNGVVNCLAPVMRKMIRRRAGHIAIVASVAAFRGIPRGAMYGPTKAALLNMAEALKLDLQSFGVELSVINPGFIDTPMTQKNKFEMPFLTSVEEAVSKILKGLEKKKFEISFPWAFAALLRGSRRIPYPLYFWLLRKFYLKR